MEPEFDWNGGSIRIKWSLNSLTIKALSKYKEPSVGLV